MRSKKSFIELLQDLDFVQDVHHFIYDKIPEEGFTLLPFLCPFRYKPYAAVRDEQGEIIGITTGYRQGITKGSQSKIDRVRNFWNNGGSAVLNNSCIKFLMGDSDVYACSSIYPQAPVVPNLDDFEILSNKAIWEKYRAIAELEMICDEQYETYAKYIQETIEQERNEHLHVDEMYHPDVPAEWKEKMIQRILSSYMLDGILMRRGVYGPNPVILGVEASSTAIIQNAALSEDEKIPVIMLKP